MGWASGALIKYGRRYHIRDMLAHGDSRAAVVVSVSPLLVACYCDDLDGVCLLRFPDSLAAGHRLQHEEDGWPGITVTLEPVACAGALLVVAFPRRFHPSGPLGERGKPVLPSELARAIRQALAAGWRADQPGKQFVWRVQEDARPT